MAIAEIYVFAGPKFKMENAIANEIIIINAFTVPETRLALMWIVLLDTSDLSTLPTILATISATIYPIITIITNSIIEGIALIISVAKFDRASDMLVA